MKTSFLLVDGDGGSGDGVMIKLTEEVDVAKR